ncbi:sec-independent protein translocase protein TatB [Tessaracoccus bendigoensis DSM 12906]|uniref:Sec-independent protein translocase protein TatB n=1 Tax=Tessaracoccus bendigoensis DSM 12906 TaxID=1123357 RepID=A0A1M6EY48_9ACTN|nr:Sec-independent protein translocase subunit TatB [Tessaracoccus bendigoensis]SHI90321.1 sec-independent protein translocase protein TatB [Tessaracoccus bendigoensis DSM 12906]
MFGIDAVELVLLLVLGVIMFGPEKLPQFSRKAARIFVYLRDIANNAKTTLGNELGPEYADLELKDLNPKAFIAKQLQNEVAMIDEAKREIKAAGETAKAGIKDATSATKEATAALKDTNRPTAEALEPASPRNSPFDPEAT